MQPPLKAVVILYRSYMYFLNFANENKIAFCSFEFRVMTDCSMPHPSLKDFKVSIFTDRLRIREIREL